MKLPQTVLLAILATLVAATPAPSNLGKVSHAGTKVFRLDISTESQAKVLNGLIDTMDLDVWSHNMRARAGDHVDLAVPSKMLASFTKTISRANIGTHTMHEDVGKSIEAEEQTMHAFSALAKKPNTQDPSWFTSYHPLADHMQWLTDFQAANAGNSRLVASGSSTEGRPIKGVQVYGSTGGGVKPAVIWHGTVHAREWITTMVVEYLTQQLVNTPEGKEFLNKYDFYIFPVVNPDGFNWAQTNDRLWRKNRKASSSSSCMGTDINRNWDAQWSGRGGASTSPCAEDYKGTSAKSTVENQGLSAFMDKIAKEQGATMFVDWHSYSQLILSPYGYDCNAHSKNYDTLERLMGNMKTAIQDVNKVEYTYGPSCSTIYMTTGDSVDYSYMKANIPHSMTVELRDTGRYGFVLPANQILPSGQETWAGLKTMLRDIDANVHSKNYQQ